ncbi:MAG: hypothetical protein ISP10_07980 [Aeromicrobium sp.]|nr:hypothetical protein [Aeromicrobium sp.]
MPETWRAHVLRERLAAECIEADVRVSDVYALEGDERHAALDVIIAERAGFPMVLVGGTVACHDGIDVDAVVAMARDRAQDAVSHGGAGSTPKGCCGSGCC